MSSKTCGECKYFFLNSEGHCKSNDGFENAHNDACSFFEQKVITNGDVIRQMNKTLFARITASPEVLAEKLVYRIIQPHYCTSGSVVRWTSTMIDWEYDTKSEAIDATVAKLKETSDV